MKQAALFICILFLLASCGRRHALPACTNTNSIFAEHSPEDREYKSELMWQLKQHDRDKLHYYIDKYMERGPKKIPFMSIVIEGDGLCARAVIEIKNENKLTDYKTVKGLTYSGSEIKGFQFGVDSSTGVYIFQFEEGVIEK